MSIEIDLRGYNYHEGMVIWPWILSFSNFWLCQYCFVGKFCNWALLDFFSFSYMLFVLSSLRKYRSVLFYGKIAVFSNVSIELRFQGGLMKVNLYYYLF